MKYAGGDDLQQNLALPGTFNIDFFNDQGFLRFPGNGGASFHGGVSLEGM
jgi:hypothetical protein